MSKNICYTESTHKERETLSATDSSNLDPTLIELVRYLALIAAESDFKEMEASLKHGLTTSDKE